MSQVWHTPTIEGMGQAEKAWYRRASRYELAGEGTPVGPRAASRATWERFDPFEYYKWTILARRDKDVGPHMDFLNLKNSMKKRHSFDAALIEFVNRHGLLGLFYDEYSAPVLPDGKIFVLPEAVIYKEDRRLRRIDPATEGMKYLEEVLRDQWPYHDRDKDRAGLEEVVCLPSDVEFFPKRLIGSRRPDPAGPEFLPRRVTWEEVREGYGALMVLDGYTSTRVSVLCTHEPYFGWWAALRDFPSGSLSATDKELANRLNSEMAEVSPHAYEGRDGKYGTGWRCSSLLRAMYVMLWMDVYEGRDIRRCDSRGCSDPYYRKGPQTKNSYCSNRCANRASTRLSRGQEP